MQTAEQFRDRSPTAVVKYARLQQQQSERDEARRHEHVFHPIICLHPRPFIPGLFYYFGVQALRAFFVIPSTKHYNSSGCNIYEKTNLQGNVSIYEKSRAILSPIYSHRFTTVVTSVAVQTHGERCHFHHARTAVCMQANQCCCSRVAFEKKLEDPDVRCPAQIFETESLMYVSNIIISTSNLQECNTH